MNEVDLKQKKNYARSSLQKKKKDANLEGSSHILDCFLTMVSY